MYYIKMYNRKVRNYNMKKLLSLLSAVAITASASTTVIACGAKTTTQDKNVVDGVKKKIDYKKEIDLVNKTNTSTTNKDTISAMKTALKTLNPTLNSEDLAMLSFASTTLTVDKATDVKLTIKFNSASDSSITLKVKIAKSDQDQANAIKEKIGSKSISVAKGTAVSTTDTDTIKTIKAALKVANNTLTTDDLKTISFSSATLATGVAVSVPTTVKVNSATATVSGLTVTLLPTNQDVANAIAAKITQATIAVPFGTTATTSTAATVTVIKAALKAANNTLTNDDLKTISFSSATLTTSPGVSVTATITVGTGAGTATATKTLTVSLQTAQETADAIINKIANKTISLPYDTPAKTDDSATIQAIKDALKIANPTLTTSDLGKLTFAVVTLTTSVKTVTATVTIGTGAGTATATKDLTVTIRTAQEEVNAIIAKITNKTLTLPSWTSPSTSTAGTKTALKAALKIANPTLTTADLTKITSFGDVNLDTTAKDVVATITVGSVATPTVTLSVSLNTPQQDVTAIKAKIKTTNISVGNGVTTASDAAVKTALKTANPTLTTDDLAKITIPATALTAGTAVKVTATITVGTGASAKTATVDLMITRAAS